MSLALGLSDFGYFGTLAVGTWAAAAAVRVYNLHERSPSTCLACGSVEAWLSCWSSQLVACCLRASASYVHTPQDGWLAACALCSVVSPDVYILLL